MFRQNLKLDFHELQRLSAIEKKTSWYHIYLFVT